MYTSPKRENKQRKGKESFIPCLSFYLIEDQLRQLAKHTVILDFQLCIRIPQHLNVLQTMILYVYYTPFRVFVKHRIVHFEWTNRSSVTFYHRLRDCLAILRFRQTESRDTGNPRNVPLCYISKRIPDADNAVQRA